MNRRSKRVISYIILGIVLGSTNLQYAQAAAEPSRKEEVVYANLDGNGVLKGTYVVNILKDKNIVDYGDYSEVKNLNTTDTITYKNGAVSATNTSDQLYYEGTLDKTDLPWNINISYRLDGVAYKADEIAGKSGKLAIEIAITKNMNAKDGFFDHFALQAVVKLDTLKCKNIEAEGSTVANIGSLKQLTYTILPGNEKDIVIKTDVTDFEMESIQINGIRLNLGIDSNSFDTSLLNNKISSLQNAAAKLNNGAGKVEDGAGSLKAGAAKQKDGIATVQRALDALNSRSSDLTSGSGKVKEALSTIQSSLNAVNSSADDLSKLSAASVKIKEGINGLVGGLKLMDGFIDTYYSKLSNAGLTDVSLFINKHQEAAAALGITDTQRALYGAYQKDGEIGFQTKLTELVGKSDTEAVGLYKKAAEGDKAAVAGYIAAAGRLIAVETLLKADVSYIQGSEQLIRGIDGSLNKDNGKLMTGALTLQRNYAVFNDNIQSMVSYLSNLAADMTLLKNGIDKLKANYDTLDNVILKYTDTVGKITDGYRKIYDGTLQMVNGTMGLYDGTKTLADGTKKFVKTTSGMKDKIKHEINQMLSEYTGSDYEVKSYVSDKNTRVESVQFVIKAAAVEKQEVPVQATAEERPLNLWQKFLRLFGLYS